MRQLQKNKMVAMATLGVMTLSAVAIAPTPANADSKNWKKATIAGAAVTGYGLLKHKGKYQTMGAVATAGSYLMYRKAKKKEEKRQAWYKSRYGSNWRSHYKSGT